MFAFWNLSISPPEWFFALCIPTENVLLPCFIGGGSIHTGRVVGQVTHVCIKHRNFINIYITLRATKAMHLLP